MNIKHLFLLLVCISGFSCQQRYAHRAKVKMHPSAKETGVKKHTPQRAMDSSGQHLYTVDSAIDSLVIEEEIAPKQQLETRSKPVPKTEENLQSISTEEVPYTGKKKVMGESQKSNAPPFELLFLAMLIAIPIIILLISNRKPKQKKDKKEKEEKHTKEFSFSDDWILRAIILVGIVIISIIIGLGLGVIGSVLLVGVLFGGSLAGLGLILLGLLFVGVALFIVGFFLIRKAAKKRLGEIDNLRFFAEFFLVLALISLISLIPFSIGFFLNLLLFIFALIILILN